MNDNRRHLQYRKRIYRKRRIRLILTVSGILLIACVLLFVIFGNLLANRRDETPSDSESTASSSERTEENFPSISVRAFPVVLETSDASTLSERLQTLHENGAEAASVPLTRPDGSLMYHSDTASALGLGNGTFSVTLSQAVQAADDYGLTLSGVYYLTAFEETDSLLRSVRLSETAAVLADALQSGMHDVLLMAPALTVDHIEELSLLASEISRLCPDGTFGFCLPSSVLHDENVAVWVSDLMQVFDFLALDATDFSDTTPTEAVHATLNGRLDYLLRYHMRLLLPCLTDEAEQAAVIAAAEQHGSQNWQILPPTESSLPSEISPA